MKTVLSLYQVAITLGVVAACCVVQSCSDNTVSSKVPLNVATVYDSSAFTTNTTAELTVRTALMNLTSEAKKGRVNGTKLSTSILTSLYQNVGNVSTVYYQGKMVGFFAEIEKASGGTYDPRKSPMQNGEGGTFGGYLFDENGLELEQFIDKGSFAAAHYNHALSIMNQPMSVANVDKIVRIFGAHPAFANTDNTANVNRDVQSAAYTARRDKNDGKGLYSQMKKALLKAQSAAKAGADYTQEYKDALAEARLIWEKALIATVINYCYAAKTEFTETNPDDEDLATGLHAYSEAVGFLLGWRTIQTKTISDAQIDSLLTLLLAPTDAAPTSYRFVQDAFNTVGNFDTVINTLRDIYGFSTQDMEDFKNNWVSLQQRN